jgi:hypothetical protein
MLKRTKNDIETLIFEAEKENPDVSAILEIAKRMSQYLDDVERRIDNKFADLNRQRKEFDKKADERMDNIRQVEIGVDEKLKELENAMFCRRKEYEMKERFRRNFEKLKSMVDGMSKEIN